MDGKLHGLIGAGVGFGVSQSVGADVGETLFLMAAGIVSSLAPDLDTASRLANRISFPHQIMQNMMRLIGSFLAVYSFLKLATTEKIVGIATGMVLFLIAPKFSRKFMLLISGVVVIGAGIYVNKTWVILAGCYIAAASLLSHRTYTHSLLGLVFFSLIAVRAEEDLGVSGLYWAAILAYASHLVADMRLIPGNKKGVKLLLPLSRWEF
ncbi:metal-dependent hydrolase [Virgibacillus sp. W0181]|uniref:metal-dependent hydrolase n=1 Tax=Virgibacillus sp. W0181 TaxID=3391581 RepID=UPI003F481155